MIRKAAILAVSALILGTGAAGAQDRTLEPSFGIQKLPFGFTPDPFTVDLLAGGDIDAFEAVGNSCFGYIAEAPDYRISYTAGDAPLIISAVSETDTTLVVAGPDGQWFCNDDSGGTFDPTVTFDAPQSGQYDIWVGTFSPVDGDFPEATLLVSEIAPETGALDWSLSPNAGTYERFAGDSALVLDLQAGGDVDVQAQLPECRGYATSAPDIRLNYTADGGPLVISVQSDRDTTLIVSDPDAGWICDDDSGSGVNPQLVLEDPLSGQYDIWIGTYSQGTGDATVTISESTAAGATLNWDLPPNFGEVDLVTGFTPDPYQVGVVPGGEVDASSVGGNCWGYTTAAPDFRLFFEPGDAPLIFSVESDIDTTLVIADPDGEWHCNDDTNAFNPAVTFEEPLSGQYDVWVATFSEGDSGSATLLISEGGNEETGVIDWSLPPVFGETELNSGFLPDPTSVEVTAGGPLPASEVDDSCRGSVTAAPTHRLYYEAGVFPLYMWVVSDTDTTLVVSGPDGTWFCDDDGAERPFDPALGWDEPQSGQYDIWVGVFGGGSGEALLFFSETDDAREAIDPPEPDPVPEPDPMPEPDPDPAPSPPDEPVFVDPDDAAPDDGAPDMDDEPVFVDPDVPPAVDEEPEPADVGDLDWQSDPLDQALTLSAGFSPDPTTVDLEAGGPVVAAAATEAAGCFGRISEVANVHLDYSADAWPLILSVESEGDTTLIVRTPFGEWVCDDDSGEGLNPSITFDEPGSGTYAIWVGTILSDEIAAATLYVSEVSSR